MVSASTLWCQHRPFLPHRLMPTLENTLPEQLSGKLHFELLPLDTLPTLSFKNRIAKQLHLLLYYSGLSSLYARFRRHPVATIVMYHSIPAPFELDWIDPCNTLSAEAFEEQIRFLASDRKVVSIDQLIEQLETNQPIRPGTVAVTFDDGYRNNLTVAAPILAKYNVPATIYLATEAITHGDNQWIDTLYSAFRARSRHHLKLPVLQSAQPSLSEQSTEGFEWDLQDPGACRAAYQAITGYLIEAGVEDKQALLAELDAQLGPTVYPPRLTLNWDEVRQLQHQYPEITLGVHTANHLDLTTHGDQSATELQSCIAQVTEVLDTSPHHFAFPYNRYDQQAIAQVKAANLHSAVAAGEDPVVRQGRSCYGLPRIEGPRSLTMLKSWTNGGFPDLSKFLFRRVWTRPY